MSIADYVSRSNYVYNNGLRNPDGTVPRRSQYAALLAKATSGVPAVEPAEKQEAAEEALEHFVDYSDKYELSAKNIFKAHKQAIGEWQFANDAESELTSTLSSRGWFAQLL